MSRRGSATMSCDAVWLKMVARHATAQAATRLPSSKETRRQAEIKRPLRLAPRDAAAVVVAVARCGCVGPAGPRSEYYGHSGSRWPPPVANAAPGGTRSQIGHGRLTWGSRRPIGWAHYGGGVNPSADSANCGPGRLGGARAAHCTEDLAQHSSPGASSSRAPLRTVETG